MCIDFNSESDTLRAFIESPLEGLDIDTSLLTKNPMILFLLQLVHLEHYPAIL